MTVLMTEINGFARRTRRATSWPPQARIEQLRALPMFAHHTDHELARADTLISEVTVPAGARLMRQGEVGREVVIVVRGSAEVTAGGRRIACVGRNDILGEMAVLDSSPRSATVTALTDMTLLAATAGQFDALCQHPHFARWVAQNMSRRLRVRQGEG